MGIFDWLFREKPRERAKAVEIDFEDFPEKLKEIKKQVFNPIFRNARRICEECSMKMAEIRDCANQLKHVKVEKETDPRLLARVESARDNLANRTVLECEYPPVLEEETVHGLNVCHSTIKQKLDNINKVGGKYGGAVSVLFNPELNKLSRKIKSLNDIFSKYSSLLTDNKELLATLINLEAYSKDLSCELEKYESAQKETKEIREKAEELKKKHEILTKEREKLKLSETYKNAVESMLLIEERRKEDERLKLNVRNNFSPIKKGLQKYMHDFELSLDKNEAVLLNLYLDEPLEGLKSDDKLIILKILEDLNRKTSMINLDVKTAEKLHKTLDELKETKFFEKSRSNYESISKEIRRLKKIIPPLQKEEELNQTIEKVFSEAIYVEKKLEASENFILDIKQKIK
ncbi:MAG TPA: hypothetical protein ENN30_01075, partial [Candidatus Woesearchaeota archaeon]|nr:hypothetical protein [Candidatus Woesearchaeota archaeon]